MKSGRAMVGRESLRAACGWSQGPLGVTLAALLLCGSPAAAQTDTVPSFEGAWKIAKPTTAPKPLTPVVMTAEGRKALEDNKRLRSQGK